MLILLASALAAPLNLFGGMMDGGAVAVAPTVYASASAVDPLLYGSVGIGSKVDLTVGSGVSSSWTGTTDAGSLDAVARYALTDELVLAVHGGMGFADDFASVGPELHWTRSFGSFDLTANAGWRAETTGGTSTVALGVAPEVWVSDRVSLFCEIDPSLALGPDADPTPALTVVPGFSANLTDDGAHALSFGVQIPVGDPTAELSGGVWYSASFELGRSTSVADGD